MKLSIIFVFVLEFSCHGYATQCPDCSTTSNSLDVKETAGVSATSAPSSSAQPMAAAETTPVSPTPFSSEQSSPPSSTATAAGASSATSTTTSAGTTAAAAVPAVFSPASSEVITVGGGISGLATAIREHLPAHENALMSPLSIGSMLAAVQMGARGNTAKQIAKVLGLHSSEDEVYWGQLAAALSAINDSPAVGAELASTIFLEKRLLPHPDFVNHVERTQTSEVVSVDFSGDQQAANDFINQWVSNSTHAKIPNILQESIGSDTVLVLASALYFNGAWNDQFHKEDTKREKFTISDSEAIEVDMMHHHAKALYATDTTAKCQVLGVPYKDEDFALFFLLPNEPGVAGLQNFEKRMSSSDLLHLLNSAYWDSVSYFVPRMRLEATFELNNALFGAGVNDLFVSTRAELGGIINPVNGSATLFVNKVAHSTVIDVTESGTEPAAPTSTADTPHAVHGDSDVDGQQEVRVDRPFLLVLQHRPTGIPVVWASVVRPTTQ